MSVIDDHYPIDCPFCAIAQAHPAPDPGSDVVPSGPAATSGAAPTAYLILNTADVLAFLDHAPISRGHVLVIAREHRSKLSDCRVDEARALGAWLPVVSRAVMKTVDLANVGDDSSQGTSHGGGRSTTHYGDDSSIGDWNIVQNNGARAAQVVPHVHFHIIPRSGAVPEVKARSWTIFGRGQREDLDDEDAEVLVQQIRDQLLRELDDLAAKEGQQTLESLIGVPTSRSRYKL